MHWFPIYTSDYIGATLDCSFDEITAYAWMLIVYYERQEPFPADKKRLFRILRCESLEQQKRVEGILSRFFIERDGYFYQEKAEQVIEKQIVSHKKRVDAGRKGGLSNAKAMPKQPEPEPEPELKPNPRKSKALSSKLDTAKEILEFLNTKTGRRFPSVDSNLKLIVARLNEGHSADDCRMVIARKWREWAGDEKMHQYARPKTLFNATNFNNYIGECVMVKENIDGQVS